ncbi:SRPBCC family protein [Halioxenophilus sp. WMMB6]|uniref:SRPBCC family protein n=1 Tax=Halioxenophilus sp. WMMB6 TaxID=3073815 RepID=UPI00295F1F1C|nr:SRPBCC family protein [Halioxenophilus sp. WMMB6]
MEISIASEINAPLAAVWQAWVTPEEIVNWNFALAEWCCPRAEIDLQVGGKFIYRMEAKDGSMGFDFEGTFTHITPNQCLRFELADNRVVTVAFTATANGVRVVETFDAEDENSAQQQKQGWQNILNNFKQHVDSKNS